MRDGVLSGLLVPEGTAITRMRVGLFCFADLAETPPFII
jgi:hypothetical protein